jgi:hypothetical protein
VIWWNCSSRFRLEHRVDRDASRGLYKKDIRLNIFSILLIYIDFCGFPGPTAANVYKTNVLCRFLMALQIFNVTEEVTQAIDK